MIIVYYPYFAWGWGAGLSGDLKFLLIKIRLCRMESAYICTAVCTAIYKYLAPVEVALTFLIIRTDNIAVYRGSALPKKVNKNCNYYLKE